MDNLKAAVRSLRSTPGPTLVVIATIAIAIGANTTIFSVVNGVLLRPLYTDDSDLVVLWSTFGDDTFRLSPADFVDVRDTSESFAGQVVLYRSIGSALTGVEQPAQIGSMAVTPRVFDVLRARPALGQFFTAEDESRGGPAKVVFTHASWLRRFGADPDIIGTVIELDGTPRTVVGITEPGFSFPPGDQSFEAYFPMPLSNAVLPDRDHRMFDAVARLSEETTLATAAVELDALAAQFAADYPDTNEGWGLKARPLRGEVLGGLENLWILSGAVFLVLLIACANIANVLVARSGSASREFAVRAALGANRSDLCRRSFAESLVLGAVGGVLGLLLAWWGTSWLRTVIPADIPRADEVGLDMRVMTFALALAVGASVLFGLLPALRSMTPDLAELLKPAGARGGGAAGGRQLRTTMVVVEVALAIVLIVAAGLLLRSFTRLSAVDPGFRAEGVVSVAVKISTNRHARAEWRPFYEQLVERVREVPGVIEAGAASDLPMSSVGLGFELEFTVPGLEGSQPTARPNADFRLILPGYLEAMGIETVQGRAFDRLDSTAARSVAIVNQTVVDRYFPEFDPIGRSLVVDSIGEVEIVGVVSDVRNGGLQSRYESEVFLPYGRVATYLMHVVVRSDLPAGAVGQAVADILGDMDPGLGPAEVVALEDLLWESVAQPRFNAALLSVLAFCAAVLAIVGTYGVVAYLVSQRTTEIGVRMALGADSASTVTMIVRQALGIVLAGTIVGIVAALGAAQLLRQVLFDIQPTDPFTYGMVFVTAVVVGTLAAWLPARRATRIDPVSALRDD